MMLQDILCMADFESAASHRMGKMVSEYVNNGADNEEALLENTRAFRRLKIRPRILRDITKIDTSSNLFGRTISFPLMIAPSGMQQMVHMDGELGTSRAAARAGVHMCVSTFSNTSLEDVKAAGDTLSRSLEKEQIGGCYALQLYVFQNRKTTEDLVRRADAAGYRAILLTVDTAVLGNRYNMTRNRFKMPSHLKLPNFGTENINLFAEQSGKAVSEPVSDEKVREEVPNDNDPSINWDETLVWLRSITNMEIWLKGILTAEDVRLAASSAARVSGIIVSNHGGRQLNSAMATIDALEDCIQAAKDSAGAGQQMQVWIDSGIRSGADIFKAVALGANGVLIGRIPLWALAVGGEAGVDKALSILKKEFTDVMGLAGCRSISEITTDHLARRTGNGFYVKL